MTPQLSEDGKFQWNGNEWTPVESSGTMEETLVATPTTASSNVVYPWLEAGEVVTDEFSGLLQHTNSNPILRVINSVASMILSVLGFKQKVKLVVTNRRVIMDVRNYSLYFFESGTDMVNVIRADSITTGFNSTLLIFKKRYLSIDNMVIGTDRKFSQSDLEQAARSIGTILK